jgi:catechol 2,3-dioxygenase-like lactoylglutathione lyase family enzyme
VLHDVDPICFVHTTDVVRARAFYVDILGLEFVEDTPFALVLRSGRTMIRVTPVPSHAATPHTVLGWDVPDIAEAMKQLIKRGVVPLRYDALNQDDLGIWRSPSGAQVAWFADPDGNTLSLTQF